MQYILKGRLDRALATPKNTRLSPVSLVGVKSAKEDRQTVTGPWLYGKLLWGRQV